jgi:hypothetical protein
VWVWVWVWSVGVSLGVGARRSINFPVGCCRRWREYSTSLHSLFYNDNDLFAQVQVTNR